MRLFDATHVICVLFDLNRVAETQITYCPICVLHVVSGHLIPPLFFDRAKTGLPSVCSNDSSPISQPIVVRCDTDSAHCPRIENDWYRETFVPGRTAADQWLTDALSTINLPIGPLRPRLPSNEITRVNL